LKRKFKNDTLTIPFDEVSCILSSLQKGICFLYKSQLYKIISNPLYDLDSKEVFLQVEYEDHFSYLEEFNDIDKK